MHSKTNTSAALVFNDTTFQVVDQGGDAWLRGAQVALALGYKNAENAIKDLYNRNASEFTEHMTAVVDLPTAGGVQKVRIFSLRGAHLLGMFARTPRAAEFRRWVLDILEGAVAPQQTGRMTFPQRLGYLKFRTQLVKDLGRCTNLGEAVELFHNLSDVSHLLGMRLGSSMEQLAPGVRQMLIEDGLKGGAA
jgi:hypothetical protein